MLVYGILEIKTKQKYCDFSADLFCFVFRKPKRECDSEKEHLVEDLRKIKKRKSAINTCHASDP